GFSDVVRQPTNFRPKPSAIFTFASIEAGDAVLCPGDSGRPLFRSGVDTSGARQIVGANSRTTYSHGVSIFSVTASAERAGFLRSGWATRTTDTCVGSRVIGG